MNRKAWIALVLLLAVILGGAGVAALLANAPAVVFVITAPYGGGASEYRYDAVNSAGRAKAVEPFASDEIVRFDVLSDPPRRVAPSGQPEQTAGPDETPLPDETIQAIKTAARGTIKSDLMQYDVLQDGAAFFAVVQLNVNWTSPCDLYRWEPETQSLNKLCRWDGVEIVGIALP